MRELLEGSGRGFAVQATIPVGVAAEGAEATLETIDLGAFDLLIVVGRAIGEPAMRRILEDGGSTPPTLYIAEAEDDPRRVIDEPAVVCGVLDWAADERQIVAAASAVAAGLVVGAPETVGYRAAPGNRVTEGTVGDPGRDGLHDRLSAREEEVLRMIFDGRINKEIATELGISENTVKFHVSSVYSKLSASNRVEALRRGVELGYLSL